MWLRGEGGGMDDPGRCKGQHLNLDKGIAHLAGLTFVPPQRYDMSRLGASCVLWYKVALHRESTLLDTSKLPDHQ